MSSIQINQFVFPDAYAQRTSCFNRVDTVAGFHAFDERGFSGVKMCIRDRKYGAQVLGLELPDEVIAAGRGMSVADSRATVSYTHLDVYKRQDLCP